MDDQQREIAAELGFVEEPCGACRAAPEPACPNCEGQRSVWRNGAASLSHSGMARLAQWTRERRQSGR